MVERYAALIVFSVFLIGALIFFILLPSGYNRELKAIKNNSANEGLFGEIKKDNHVVFYGFISRNNPLLISDFVIGLAEEYESGEDGGWETQEIYKQDFYMQSGGMEVKVVPLRIYVTGLHNELTDPKDSGKRIVGFVKGSALTVEGKIISVSPLVIESKNYYGGDLNQYIASLKSNRNLYMMIASGPLIFMSIFFIISLVKVLRKR